MHCMNLSQRAAYSRRIYSLCRVANAPPKMNPPLILRKHVLENSTLAAWAIAVQHRGDDFRNYLRMMSENGPNLDEMDCGTTLQT